MSKIIHVLTEKDLEDGEISVIGVADSLENAQKVMDKYYGEYEVINHYDIRDSQLEWEKTIAVEYDNLLEMYPEKFKVTLQWFELNKI